MENSLTAFALLVEELNWTFLCFVFAVGLAVVAFWVGIAEHFCALLMGSRGEVLSKMFRLVLSSEADWNESVGQRKWP